MNILEIIGMFMYFIVPIAVTFYFTNLFDTNFSKAIACFVLIVVIYVSMILLCGKDIIGMQVLRVEQCEVILFSLGLPLLFILFTGIFYIILGLISGKGS